MTRPALEKLIARESLTRGEAADLMRAIMAGELTDAQLAGLLVALRAKGETVEEITGFVTAMRERSVKIPLRANGAVDTCGTGGDARGTFNISTATALVAAGMGITVAKHGNRAISSKCGSADVLEALGVNIDLLPDKSAELIERVGIGFLFAPHHHPAMKHAATARRDLGLRTVFNLLGPMTNPAGVRRQLVGVFAPEHTETVARVLHELGSERVYAVHGLDGSDEVSVTAPTRVSALEDGSVRTFEFDPTTVGIPRAREEDLIGGTAAENARLIEDVLSGAKGPRRDAVVINTSFTSLAAGRAADVEEGVALARESIDSGRARATLEALKTVSHELGLSDTGDAAATA
ncbi:MAG: anthranilate phosphoribosyltransferase [Planctomycetota bacterium]|jgi:anthranilate phosphoribosyltransferase